MLTLILCFQSLLLSGDILDDNHTGYYSEPVVSAYGGSSGGEPDGDSGSKKEKEN